MRTEEMSRCKCGICTPLGEQLEITYMSQANIVKTLEQELAKLKAENDEYKNYILKLESLVNDIGNHCLCTRSTKGFERIHDKENGICNSWKYYKKVVHGRPLGGGDRDEVSEACDL